MELVGKTNLSLLKLWPQKAVSKESFNRRPSGAEATEGARQKRSRAAAEEEGRGPPPPPHLRNGAAANAPWRPRGNIIARQKLNYEIRKQ